MRHDSLALILAAGALSVGAMAAALTPVEMAGPVTAAARQAADDLAPSETADSFDVKHFDAGLAMAGPNTYPMRYASGSTVTARIVPPSPYDTPIDAGFDAVPPQADAATEQFDSAMADDVAPDDGDEAAAAQSDDGFIPS